MPKTLGLSLKSKRKRVDSDPSTADKPPNPDYQRPRSNSLGSPPAKQQRTSHPHGPEASDEDFDSGIERTRGLLVPGFRYLGPGNPTDNGPPTNRVDAIAQQHDQAYQQAIENFKNTGDSERSFEQIHLADDEFINNIDNLEPGSFTESYGKFIGQIGIKAKRAVEGLLHSTLYPRFTTSEEMDVVDSGTAGNETEKVYSVNNDSFQPSMISIGNGVRRSHSTSWNFNKQFQFGFESHVIEYKKTEASANLAQGQTDVYTYIHSLPWERLYFYLTEREYNTITNTFHTAYVDYVKIKIYNMGVNIPTLVQKNDVSYKLNSSSSYLGIWRGFEKHGPVSLGTQITPRLLYGLPLVDLSPIASKTKLPGASLGAVSEMKNVDNRVVYNKITSQWKENQKKNIPEAQVFLPPLLDMAAITLNANTSVGLIYETVYKPKDGLFHNKSFAFHNAAVVQHKPYEQNIDLADRGKISDATYDITDSSSHNSPIIEYKNATIDNMFFRSLRGNNSLDFVQGLGVGLFPKRDKSDLNVDMNLELSIHTEIGIKAEAFGGSVLSSGTADFPQSNPNNIYFVHKNKKYGNAYASDGLPTLSNV